MVRDRLAEDDAADGFLLDGFPRNVAQADELNGILDKLGSPLTVVLDLEVDTDEVVKRLSGRRTCKKCGHVWHLEFDPPSVEGVCDRCGGLLYQRDDDLPETVRHRLEVYADQTAPLIGFYRKLGKLVAIEALGHVEDVTERAIAALSPMADA
jgi:adenylate kinase